MNKGLMAIVGLVLIGGGAVVFWQASAPKDNMTTPRVNTMMHGAGAGAAARPADEIIVPKLSSAAQMG